MSVSKFLKSSGWIALAAATVAAALPATVSAREAGAREGRLEGQRENGAAAPKDRLQPRPLKER